MKILHVLEATLGGTRQYVDDVIAAKLDCEQALLYASDRADSRWPEVLEAATAAGWTCVHVDMRRSIKPLNDAKALAEIVAFIRRYRPDVIHCHSSKAGALGRAAAVLSRTRAKVMYSPHALAHHISKFFLLIERGLAPFTQRFCAVSESERREIAAAGLAPLEKIAVVSPAIRADRWVPEDAATARKRLGISEDAEIVVGVGRLVPQKNPLAFVEVLAPLFEQRPHLRAFWVGDGELRQAMLEKMRELGCEERITITDWSDDVRSYFAAANVVLSTAIYESFGYVAAEALAMERPVVAANVSGIKDILDRELKALLFFESDRQAARQTICRLLNDSVFRETFVYAGKEKVRTAYSLSALKQNLETLYSSTKSTA